MGKHAPLSMNGETAPLPAQPAASDSGQPAALVTQIQSPTRYEQGGALYGPRLGDLRNPLASQVTTRLQEALRRLTSAREPAVLELLAGVSPVVALLDLAEAENRILRNEILCSQSTTAGPVAAQLPTIIIVNETPNSLLIVDSLIVSSAAAQSIFVGPDITLGAAGGSAFTRQDTRAAPSASKLSNRLNATTTVTPISQSAGNFLLPANDSRVIPMAIVLTNGTQLAVQGQTVNTQIWCTARCRQRFNVDRSELENFPAP